MTLAQELDEARERVRMLERRAAAATCAELGRHAMVTLGGMNCGCPNGACSVPVYTCTRCGDYDYGDNAEAVETRRACAERWVDA